MHASSIALMVSLRNFLFFFCLYALYCRHFSDRLSLSAWLWTLSPAFTAIDRMFRHSASYHLGPDDLHARFPLVTSNTLSAAWHINSLAAWATLLVSSISTRDFSNAQDKCLRNRLVMQLWDYPAEVRTRCTSYVDPIQIFLHHWMVSPPYHIWYRTILGGDRIPETFCLFQSHW